MPPPKHLNSASLREAIRGPQAAESLRPGTPRPEPPARGGQARQLRAWLDPAGTGQLTLDGLDPSTNTLRAANDSFTSVPDDSAQLLLDVLSNDAGQQPLRLLSARAANGQVRVQGQQLLWPSFLR